MPKLRNRATGVVVSTSAEVAAQLTGPDWEPADSKAPKQATGKTEK